MSLRRYAPAGALSALGIAACFAPLACGSGESPSPGYVQEPTTGAGGAGGSGEGGGGDSSGSSSAKSAASTSSGAGGASGGAGGSASGAGGAGGEDCPDTGDGEPNETEGAAVDLGDVTDCDGDFTLTVLGVLAGPDDVDWYKYAGEDVAGCTVDPSRTLASAYATEICKYAECSGGEAPSFKCPSGAVASTSPEGRAGCCSLQGFSLSPDCPGTSDDATVYIRLSNPDKLDCIPYTLKFHY